MFESVDVWCVCLGRDLAADLAQITFDFPFKIPPYFALIIRAISVLEGIALVGNPGTLHINLTVIQFDTVALARKPGAA